MKELVANRSNHHRLHCIHQLSFFFFLFRLISFDEIDLVFFNDVIPIENEVKNEERQ